MKKLILFLSILLFTFSAKSQTLNWSKQIGNPTLNTSNNIASDAAGNVYVLGGFQFSPDFDPGPGVQTLSSYNNSVDVFLAKYDNAGNFLWVRKMGGNFNEGFSNLLVDPAGNAYCYGLFLGIGTFGSTVLDVAQGEVFLTKIDPSGNFVWAGQLKCHFPRTIDLIGSDILISGHNYAITTDFDMGAGVSEQTFTGYVGQYIARYTSGGVLVWAKILTGPAATEAQNAINSVYVDAAENIYSVNKFKGAIDFDPNAGSNILTGVGPELETGLFKLNSTGVLQWAKQFAGSTPIIASTIAPDPGGNLQVSGTIVGTADMDPGIGITNLTAVNNRALYLSKFDQSGNFISTRKIDGPASASDYLFQYNSFYKANGKNVIEVLASGKYDFGDGVTEYFNQNVIACYDATNNLLWKEVMPTYTSGIFSESGSNMLTVGDLTANNTDVDPESGPAHILNMKNINGQIFFRRGSIEAASGPILVASYPFSGNANDATGNVANNGTVNGANLTTDRFGNANSAYYFDGVDDFIEANADNLPTGSSTVSLWFKADAGSMMVNPGLLGYGGNAGACPGNSFLMQLYSPGGPISFVTQAHCASNLASFVSPIIPEDKWYNWVVTTNGTTIKMYLNGKLVSTTITNTQPKIVAGKKLNIGAVVSLFGSSNYTDGNVGRFKGVLDDVKIYDGVLPASEIFDNYIKDQTKPGSGNGLQLTRTGAKATDPWVNIGSGYDFGAEPFTYETWVKRDDLHTTLNNNGIAFIVSEPTNGWGVGLDNTNTLFFTKASVNAVYATGTIADTKWHHVAVVYTGTQIKFYIDGIAAGAPAYNDNFNNSSGNYTIGARQNLGNSNGDQTINGMIDETRIWRNIALSQTEIRDWMCKKITSSHPNYEKLFAYFNFDETTNPVRGFGGNFGAFVNNPILQTSGAAIGDISANDYLNATKIANLSHLSGENFAVTSASGAPAGIQVYKVDELPNSISGIGSLGTNMKYFGVFQVGGTSPTYNAVYNYSGNTVTPTSTNLRLFSRANNSVNTWAENATMPNIGLNTITLTGQSTEYILAQTLMPLPLNLLSFLGKNENGNNILNWQTANEIALSHFEIERSENVRNFEKIGELKANGGPSEKVSYEYIDTQLAPHNSKLFYRLKMVDLDGKFKYSKIINIENKAQSELTIYPNPTIDYFSLSENQSFEKLQIVDMAGRFVKEFLPQTDNKYSLKSLSAGVYLVKLAGGNRLTNSKLIIE